MPKYKVANLTGDKLDAAVALADGRLVVADEPGWPKGDYKKLRAEYGGRHVVRWYGTRGELGGWEPIDNQGSPSTDWRLGGPIIEREKIAVIHSGGDWSAAVEGCCGIDGSLVPWRIGGLAEDAPTALVAAMRAYVAAKLGQVVDLPQ